VDHQIDGSELVPRKVAKTRFRDSVLIAFDYRCAYCLTALSLRSATLDHVIPKAKGGLTVRSNLVPCCLQCNAHKQHHDWAKWYQSQLFYCEMQERIIARWLDQ